jgi:hypothetical protein
MENESTRRCGRCGEVKPIESFNWRRRAIGQRDNMCRACRAAYHHEHYSANKIRYITQARERKRALALERTEWLLRYFEDHPCQDCGETDAIVLEFDHRRDKAFNIGSVLPYRNWESILAEIEKCDVVCANCHRRRTARRLGCVRSHLVAGRGRQEAIPD